MLAWSVAPATADRTNAEIAVTREFEANMNTAERRQFDLDRFGACSREGERMIAGLPPGRGQVEDLMRQAPRRGWQPLGPVGRQRRRNHARAHQSVDSPCPAAATRHKRRGGDETKNHRPLADSPHDAPSTLRLT